MPDFQVLRFGTSKKEISKDTIKRPCLVQAINKFITEHMAPWGHSNLVRPMDNMKDASFWQVQVYKVKGALTKDMQFSIASTPLQICVLTKRADLEARASRMLAVQPPNGQAMAVRDACGKFAAIAQGSAWGTEGGDGGVCVGGP